MEEAIVFECVDGLGERKAAVEEIPLAGVTMPPDVEAVSPDPVQSREGAVELLAEIILEAGPIALDEAVFGAVPLSEDVGLDS